MRRVDNPASPRLRWSLLLQRLCAWLASVLIAFEALHLLDPKSQWNLSLHILVGVVLTVLLVPLLSRLLRVPLFRSR